MKTNKILITMILVLLASSASFAQVNTERKRMGLKKSGFSGSISLTYAVTMGNSELIEFGLAPNVVWRMGRHQMFMLNDLDLVSSDDQDIISEGFSHVRYNLDITNHFVYELFLQAQYDKSQELEERRLAGTGIRILYINDKQTLVANGLTFMYEYEELSDRSISEIIRGSVYLSTRFNLNNTVKFRNAVYFQPKLDEFEDYRILDEGELSIFISENISFISSIKYRYDSKPPFSIKHYDLSLDNGLKFVF